MQEKQNFMSLGPCISMKFILLSWRLFTTFLGGFKQLLLPLEIYRVFINPPNLPPFPLLPFLSILPIQCFLLASKPFLSNKFLPLKLPNKRPAVSSYSSTGNLHWLFRCISSQQKGLCFLLEKLPGKRKEGNTIGR